MEYKNLFKSRRIPSLAESLAKRCQSVAAERQEKRRELFWGAVVSADAASSNKTETLDKKKTSRVEMLRKWKEEKKQRLEEAKKKQKPAFKVGVVQRKVTGSPLFSQSRIHEKNNLMKEQSHVKSQICDLKEKKTGVLTRAGAKAKNITLKPIETEKVLLTIKDEKKFNKFCKIDAKKRVQVNSTVFKVPEVVSKLPCSSLTFPYSPKVTKKTNKSIASKENKVKSHSAQKDSQPEENPEKENVPNREGTPLKQDDFRPIHYSPFVTVRSGKKSPRRKPSSKRFTMDVDEQIKMEEQQFHCRIFSFRKYIQCETKRLAEVCDKWKRIYEEFEEIPVEVEGDIDSAIGKTKLLTSDKFKQFSELIEKCENGDPFVKVDDLQGFQDWVSIEVERIDNEFLKLEKRKFNDWREEAAPSLPRDSHQINLVKIPPRKKPVGKSNIRAHILAARKLLKEGNANGGEELQLRRFSMEKVGKVGREKSLLKEVLDIETKVKTKTQSPAKKFPVVRERRNSGLEIMVATQKNKFPTPVKKSPGVRDYQVFFGEEKTPNRSILKKTPKSNSSKGRVARVTFKKAVESGGGGGRGLSEKYFQAVTDSEEESPKRVVLGDVGNFFPEGVRTRSKSKLSSDYASKSPQYCYS